ncbi:MAG: SprT-like domain-containing protein [Muribaculum sp.]|nr:SprT-like domain-containing protein [Muribaculaceae bacterium]MCM1081164.1 SprT-like domain-containing protein [Muribaculum sp.]
MLPLANIRERHSYWLEKIAGAGIWNRAGFKPVSIIVKPFSRTCNGKFQRKTTIVGGKRTVSDSIIIYLNSADGTEMGIDNVLVHEMIHQYIYQSGLTDTSSHGQIFRSLMTRINTTFADQLHIAISTRSKPTEAGPGSSEHIILSIQIGEHVYCCPINQSRVKYFALYLHKNRTSLRIDSYSWYISDDRHFNRVSHCRTRLHGEKIAVDEFSDFVAHYRMQLIRQS